MSDFENRMLVWMTSINKQLSDTIDRIGRLEAAFIKLTDAVNATDLRSQAMDIRVQKAEAIAKRSTTERGKRRRGAY